MPPRTKHLLTSAIASLLIFLFVYTPLSKLLEFDFFEATLYKSPLIGDKAPYVAVGLPIVETLVSALLFFGKTRKIGFYASLFLMGFFTMYILYMFLFVPELPCSCGGVLKSMSWNGHLLFNLIFLLLAFFGILTETNNTNSVKRTASLRLSG